MTSKKIRVSREFDSWMKRIKLQFKNEFGKTLSDPEITFIICKCFPHPQYLLDVDMLKDLDLNNSDLQFLNSVYIETRYPPDLGLLPGGEPTEKDEKDAISRKDKKNEKMKSKLLPNNLSCD